MLERKSFAGISYLIGGQGKAVLCLHGIPGSSYIWQGVGETLAVHFQVIIPDLSGFGESEMPTEVYYVERMEAQCRKLFVLLDHLGIREVILCAHDFGGPTSLTFIRMATTIQVKALVITNTNIFPDTPVPLPLKMAHIPVLGYAFYRLAFGTRLGLWGLYMAAVKKKENLPWERYKRHLTPNGMRSTSDIFYVAIRDMEGSYRATEDTLNNLQIPLLVLWAGSDPLFDVSDGEKIASRVAGSQLKIYEDCGHFVPEEVPGISRDIRDFLAKVIGHGADPTAVKE